MMCIIGLSKLPLRQLKYLCTNFKFEFYNFAENVAIHSNSLIETTQKQREVPTTYSKKVKNRFYLNLKHLNFEVMVSSSSSTSNLSGTNSISNTTKLTNVKLFHSSKKTNLGRC